MYITLTETYIMSNQWSKWWVLIKSSWILMRNIASKIVFVIVWCTVLHLQIVVLFIFNYFLLFVMAVGKKYQLELDGKVERQLVFEQRDINIPRLTVTAVSQTVIILVCQRVHWLEPVICNLTRWSYLGYMVREGYRKHIHHTEADTKWTPFLSTFSIVFSWMKIFQFRLEFHCCFSS